MLHVLQCRKISLLRFHRKAFFFFSSLVLIIVDPKRYYSIYIYHIYDDFGPPQKLPNKSFRWIDTQIVVSFACQANTNCPAKLHSRCLAKIIFIVCCALLGRHTIEKSMSTRCRVAQVVVLDGCWLDLKWQFWKGTFLWETKINKIKSIASTCPALAGKSLCGWFFFSPERIGPLVCCVSCVVSTINSIESTIEIFMCKLNFWGANYCKWPCSSPKLSAWSENIDRNELITEIIVVIVIITSLR